MAQKEGRFVSLHGCVHSCTSGPGWLTRIIKTRDGRYWRAMTHVLAWYTVPSLQQLRLDLDTHLLVDKGGKRFNIYLEHMSDKEVLQFKLTH